MGITRSLSASALLLGTLGSLANVEAAGRNMRSDDRPAVRMYGADHVLQMMKNAQPAAAAQFTRNQVFASVSRHLMDLDGTYGSYGMPAAGTSGYGDKDVGYGYGGESGQGMTGMAAMYGSRDAAMAYGDAPSTASYGTRSTDVAYGEGSSNTMIAMEPATGTYGARSAAPMYGTAEETMEPAAGMYGTRSAAPTYGAAEETMKPAAGMYGTRSAASAYGTSGEATEPAYGTYGARSAAPAYGAAETAMYGAAAGTYGGEPRSADSPAYGMYESEVGMYGMYAAGDAEELAEIIVSQNTEPVDEAVEEIIADTRSVDLDEMDDDMEDAMPPDMDAMPKNMDPDMGPDLDDDDMDAMAPAPSSYMLPEAESPEDWNCFCDSEDGWLEYATFFSGCVDAIGHLVLHVQDEEACHAMGETWVEWQCGETMDLLYTYGAVTCAEPGFFSESTVGLQMLCCNDAMYDTVVADSPLPAAEKPDWDCVCVDDGAFLSDSSFFLCEAEDGDLVPSEPEQCGGDYYLHELACGSTLDGLWADYDMSCFDTEEFPIEVLTALAIGCCNNGDTLTADVPTTAAFPTAAPVPAFAAFPTAAPLPTTAALPSVAPAAAPEATFTAREVSPPVEELVAAAAAEPVEESPFPATAVPCAGMCTDRHKKCAGKEHPTFQPCCDPDDVCMKKNEFHWQCVTPSRYERKLGDGWLGTILTCAAE